MVSIDGIKKLSAFDSAEGCTLEGESLVSLKIKYLINLTYGNI